MTCDTNNYHIQSIEQVCYHFHLPPLSKFHIPQCQLHSVSRYTGLSLDHWEFLDEVRCFFVDLKRVCFSKLVFGAILFLVANSLSFINLHVTPLH